MATDPLSDPELPALVELALEKCDQGLEPDFEAICRVRPDLREAVEGSVKISRQLPGLRRRAAAQDRFLERVLLNRYRLVKRMGSGAMGVVYEAEDLELKRSVAVKILRTDFLDAEESEQRFLREAEALATIRHSSVVTIHDRGRTSEGDAFIVMEFLEGQPLSHLLEVGAKLPEARRADTQWIAQELGESQLGEGSYLRAVIHWAAELAGGLEAAHGQGIYHRDVKPSNVYVCKDGRSVLVDFGIASQVSQATITRDDAALGTPAYMAPESMEPGNKASAALDVYGLTATLYHMLTLRSPYSGSPTQILSQLARKDPAVARKISPNIPRDVQAILDCGMSRRVSGRYRSAAELEAELRAFLEYRPVKARNLSSVGRLWLRLRRSPAFIAGAGVGGLILLVFAGYFGRAAWNAHLEAAHNDVWRHRPPILSFSSPSSRVLTEAGGRVEVEALLDEAADLCVDVLPTYAFRAAFRLDHGDSEGAAEDMRRVAESVGSPYARELARRYSALEPGVLKVDCSDLPEPESEMDVYLAAFHAMRDGRGGDAKALVLDPRLANFGPAREIELLFMKREPQRMFEVALGLEAAYGQRTAFTAYILGLAQIALKHYDRAVLFLEEGVELAPGSARLRVNTAYACGRLGRFEEARTHLEQAIEFDPSYWRPYENLTQLLIDAGELDAALETIESAPPDMGGKWPLLRLSLSGETETVRAILAYVSGDIEGSKLAAQRANAYFEEAAQDPSFDAGARVAIGQALVTGERSAVVRALADLIEKDPLNWRRLDILLDWIPPQSDSPDSQALRAKFESILVDWTPVQNETPESQALKAKLESILEDWIRVQNETSDSRALRATLESISAELQARGQYDSKEMRNPK